MSMTLDQIIQQGGPVGFALLFAFMWLRSEKKVEKLEGIVTASQDEVKTLYKDQAEFWQKYSGGPS